MGEPGNILKPEDQVVYLVGKLREMQLELMDANRSVYALAECVDGMANLIQYILESCAPLDDEFVAEIYDKLLKINEKVKD